MKQDDERWQLDRLSADEAPELHRALGIAQQQLPSSGELAALAASLSAHGVPSPGAASPPAAQGGPITGKYWAIGAAAVVGAAVLAGAAWLATGARVPGPHRPAAADSVASSGTGAPRAVSEPGFPDLPPVQAATGRVRALAPASAAFEPLASAAPSSAPEAAFGAAAHAPASPLARERAPERTSAAASTPPPHGSQTSAGPRGSTSSPSQHAPVGAGVAAPPSEIALLRDARLALPSSPALALGLTEQHSALYPRGALAQERELIAITALSRLGRHAAVLSRAQRFAADFPGSPYRKQVAELAH